MHISWHSWHMAIGVSCAAYIRSCDYLALLTWGVVSAILCLCLPTWGMVSETYSFLLPMYCWNSPSGSAYMRHGLRSSSFSLPTHANIWCYMARTHSLTHALAHTQFSSTLMSINTIRFNVYKEHFCLYCWCWCCVTLWHMPLMIILPRRNSLRVL